MRQKVMELQGKIDESTIILGGFSTPLSVTDISSRQKIIRHSNTVQQPQYLLGPRISETELAK